MTENQEINKNFWTFVYLISNYPEKYLNSKGKILQNLVLREGECQSITRMARDLQMHIPTVSKLCKETLKDNHVTIFREGNRSVIIFNAQVVEKSIELAHGVEDDKQECN